MPSTQLFTVSVGVMAIQAAACGLCSCADTVPASWKTSTESYDKVFTRWHVMYMYTLRLSEGSRLKALVLIR